MCSETRGTIVMMVAVALAAVLYLLWWRDQPENWPVSDSYYKSGKAPDLPGKWIPDAEL